MKIISRALPLCGLLSAALWFAPSATAEVDVQTLGGGRLTVNGPDYGSADGNTFSQAQFNTPWATAIDSTGTMYMADRLNNAIRKITLVGNTTSSQTTTYLTGLNAPIGVVIDGGDNLYILTSDNVVRKYNSFKNQVASNYLGNVSGPSAMCMAPNGSSLYICYTSGCILEAYQNGTTRTVLSNCGTMRGIGVLPSGEIVVSLQNSTSFNNAIVVCATNNANPALPTVHVLSGNNGAGFVDGAPGFAKFNNPHGLAVTVDGKVVVADRGNNRVRIVDPAGITTTLYGIDSTNWNASYFPGWVDGDNTVAASREPVSVTISTNGVVFTTEVYYHILREVTGSGLTTGATGGAGNTNSTVTVTPPTFSPNCGYYPNCQTITVQTGGGSVYYTMDGTEPTTNSIYIPTSNNQGTFTWCNPTKSLAGLKMKAFIGTNSSTTVSGIACGDNEIGFTRDMVAGVGSTVWLPVVASLQSGGTLKSLQFRVEATPANGAPPMLGSDLTIQAISSNDFVQVVAPGQNVSFQPFAYSNGTTRGLVVSAPGNSGLSINGFAVVAVLKVIIPKTCVEGQSYQLSVLFPSGTSDGVQADVPLIAMPARNLTVQNVAFLAGDSSPGRWYNAGDFGDASPVLSSADVNNAMYAALGIRVPYKFSDAFRAMDTAPETPNQVGDLAITYNDWQTILFRSVGFDTNNWIRFWGANGLMQHTNTTQIVTPHGLTPNGAILPGNIWLRQAAIGSGVAVSQLPGASCSLPVWVNVLPGCSLAGMQFRATLVPEGNAPMPGAITFNPATGITGGQVLPGVSPNDIVCTWSFGALASPLKGSNYIGQINFTVPPGAGSSQHYSLHFSYFDGSPDLNTFYQLESFPGSTWVMSGATNTPSCTSDEWKTAFFGNMTNALAADNVDADGDGVPNWKEFLAGTDPTNAASCLQFSSAMTSSNTTVLTWLTAPAKNYIIEAAPSITSTSWTVVGSDAGDGTIHQVTEPNNGTSQFYRIRLQP